MIMQEHENNQFTAQRTDVEKYLFRIIQRYFDTQNIYNQASIESIIVEALTRYKREIYTQKSKFVFSLNEKTGHLFLTIQDFGGEYAFEKNDAFNKDFGSVFGTICEGNDYRLFNEREPLEHVHDIGEVTGLREILDSYVDKASKEHHHRNQNALDIITYSKALAEIDLIIIEDMVNKIDIYRSQLNQLRNNASMDHIRNMDSIGRALYAVQEELANLSEIIMVAINWLDESKIYIRSIANELKDETLRTLSLYLKNSDAEALVDYLKKVYIMVEAGEIPIPDEELKFNFTEDIDFVYTESVKGEGIKNIYQNGLCFGNVGDMNWIWDDTLESIVELNNTTEYTGYVSTGSFKSYTHRVTLSSKDSDDDVITAIVLYNRATGNHLEVVCEAGMDNAGSTPTKAKLVYNYRKTGSVTIDQISYASDYGWNTIANGMTVLIKKMNNNIRVWVNYNTPNTWVSDENNEINPEEPPTFEINLTDYSYLSEFVDQSSCYGYGCYSQAYSTYSNIFFRGMVDYGSEKPGETVISGSSTIEQSSSSVPEIAVNGKAKLFFRYDKDGETYTIPLPYIFKVPSGHCVIQGYQDDNGKIHIDANIVNKLSGHIGPENFYKNKYIIFSSAIHKGYCYDLIKELKDQNCILCPIDSDDKKEFVKSIIRDTTKIYYINAHKDLDEDKWMYIDEEDKEYSLPYNVSSFQNGISGKSACIDAQGNLYTVDGVLSKNGYIAQYKIQRISNYFDNPRIYYQVYKEGV